MEGNRSQSHAATERQKHKGFHLGNLGLAYAALGGTRLFAVPPGTTVGSPGFSIQGGLSSVSLPPPPPDEASHHTGIRISGKALDPQGSQQSQGTPRLRSGASALPSWLPHLSSPDCTKTSRDLLYIVGRSSHINFVRSTAGIIAAHISFFLGYISRDPVSTGRCRIYIKNLRGYIETNQGKNGELPGNVGRRRNYIGQRKNYIGQCPTG